MQKEKLSMKSLMLWNNDFRKRDWKVVCETLDLPEETQEVELKVQVITAFPYKHGRAKVDVLSDALSIYDNKSEPLEIAMLPWNDNIKQEAIDFVTALRAADIAEIAVTDDSTNLLECIHALVDAGAELVGTVMFRSTPHAEERCGLRFKISGQ